MLDEFIDKRKDIKETQVLWVLCMNILSINYTVNIAQLFQAILYLKTYVHLSLCLIHDFASFSLFYYYFFWGCLAGKTTSLFSIFFRNLSRVSLSNLFLSWNIFHLFKIYHFHYFFFLLLTYWFIVINVHLHCSFIFYSFISISQGVFQIFYLYFYLYILGVMKFRYKLWYPGCNYNHCKMWLKNNMDQFFYGLCHFNCI